MKTPSFWPSTGVYIGIGWFQKTRRGHASKINAWLHSIAAFLRQYQGITSLGFASESPLVLAASWYIPFLVISPEYSSDVRKSLGSSYLLDDPLLGLHESIERSQWLRFRSINRRQNPPNSSQSRASLARFHVNLSPLFQSRCGGQSRKHYVKLQA